MTTNSSLKPGVRVWHRYTGAEAVVADMRGAPGVVYVNPVKAPGEVWLWKTGSVTTIPNSVHASVAAAPEAVDDSDDLTVEKLKQAFRENGLPKPDPVNLPSHYRYHPSGVECIELVEHLGFRLGNVVKYVFRHEHKGTALRDLEKARTYLEREIADRSKEEWGTYPLDRRYEASTQGRIRRADSGRVRKLVPIKSGYLTFMTTADGRPVLHYAHRAVASTFLGDVEGMIVAHANGRRDDNRLHNLRICTQRENLQDRRLHGSHYFGAQNPGAKLSPDDVAAIRASTDETVSDLAALHGVSASTVERILSGQAWADHRLAREVLLDRFLESETREWVANVVELIWRADHKGKPLEDLRKARWYIDREIARREKGDG